MLLESRADEPEARGCSRRLELRELLQIAVQCHLEAP